GVRLRGRGRGPRRGARPARRDRAPPSGAPARPPRPGDPGGRPMSTSPGVRRESAARPSSTVAIDLAAVRRDFPILSRQVHGKPLVYLDNAASSQKPRVVIDAECRLYEEYYANV